jgi:hypothetical protein
MFLGDNIWIQEKCDNEWYIVEVPEDGIGIPLAKQNGLDI